MCTPRWSPPRCSTGCPDVAATAGYRADGLLTREAHHRGRGLVNRLFTDADRRAAARRALRQAARSGVATVHELGGPHLGPLEDLTRVREVGAELGLDVVTYWGELAVAGGDRPGPAVGAAGLAGDLCIDGSIGSRTAALHAAVRRRRHTRGPLPGRRRDRRPRRRRAPAPACRPASTASATTRWPRPSPGCAGPRERSASAAIRAARHRLEHLEMVAAGDIADPGRARGGGQRAAGVRRRRGAGRGSSTSTAGRRAGADDEPVRHAAPRRRTAGLRHRRAGHPASPAGPWSGPRRSTAGRSERLTPVDAFAAATAAATGPAAPTGPASGRAGARPARGLGLCGPTWRVRAAATLPDLRARASVRGLRPDRRLAAGSPCPCPTVRLGQRAIAGGRDRLTTRQEPGAGWVGSGHRAAIPDRRRRRRSRAAIAVAGRGARWA